MLSWFSVRLATVLVVAVLFGSSIQLLRSLEANGDGWEAEQLAETYAHDVNAHLIVEESFITTIHPPRSSGDGDILVHPSTVRAKVGRAECSSPLVSTLHLWSPGEVKKWGSDEMDAEDESHPFLEVKGDMVLERKWMKVDGITFLEAFLYPDENTRG